MTPDQALAQLHNGRAAATTGDDAPAAATVAAAAGAEPAPGLLHSGVYAIWATPDGGRHVVYRPTGADADVHIPEIPAAALGLVENFLTYGLPPHVVAMLGGHLSPTKLLGMVRQISRQMAAEQANGRELEGGADDAGG